MPKELKLIDNKLIDNIKDIISQARQRVYKSVNYELLFAYWNIGKEIVKSERKKSIDSNTSRQVILALSKQLTKEIGKGFSRSNLFNMRKFYIEYPSVQPLAGHLTWTHICELLTIEDKNKRSFYEKETKNLNWSKRELIRQIDTSLYERLLLSKGKTNKKTVL